MRRWAASLLPFILAACAAAPVPVAPPTDVLFYDRAFRAPSETIRASDVMAISKEMERFLAVDIKDKLNAMGVREGLIDAIYSEGQLKIEYDSVSTRNASQTFAARSGNCLSLVIMTAAFSKALGLPVQFQSVSVDESLSRVDDIYFYIGHVNLTLGSGRMFSSFTHRTADLLTVDFLPPQETQGLRTRPIAERTVIAMYMNNRAAEAFARGQVDDAYWWARTAIEEDPQFLSAYNTLGVVYRRHGNPAQAEKVLAYVLEREPRNTRAMSNLVGVLNDLGRFAQAEDLSRRLKELEPNPAFSYFDPGLKAMREGNYRAARDLFAKEVARAPYYHEFHFWLANAYFGLGDVEQARRQLMLAMEYSTTRKDHDLYAAKLDRIRSSQLR